MSQIANLTLRAANAADAKTIRRLLELNGLPTSDLDTARPEFVIASRDEEIVGIGALELFGSAALLRLVAVEARYRGCGVARLIVAELERHAFQGSCSHSPRTRLPGVATSQRVR